MYEVYPKLVGIKQRHDIRDIWFLRPEIDRQLNIV